MRGIGCIIAGIGLIWALIAYNMNTTVTTEAKRFGSGEFVINVPSQTVHNLGLMEIRRNHLMFAGGAVIVGVLLLGFGTVLRGSNSSESQLRPCPFCAERIQPSAHKCRYCASDLPDAFRLNVHADANATYSPGMRHEQMQLIETGRATFETYSNLLRSVGGTIVSVGILGTAYVVSRNGVETKVGSFDDLRLWFLSNFTSPEE